jgi:hypothetical protein
MSLKNSSSGGTISDPNIAAFVNMRADAAASMKNLTAEDSNIFIAQVNKYSDAMRYYGDALEKAENQSKDFI